MSTHGTPKTRQKARVRVSGAESADAPVTNAHHASVIEEARLAGLLDGDKTEHVSFRATPALVEAAKRETGIASTSELGLLALAMLARRTR